MTNNDTIIACASGSGRAGVAIIRLSGPASFSAIHRLTGKSLPKERMLVRRNLYWPSTYSSNSPSEKVPNTIENKNRDIIDNVLIALFKAPNSYNGDDIAEIHCHGSTAVISAIIKASCSLASSKLSSSKLASIRLANPGEFTRRAVLNGKQNIFQAESLIDLIEAETEQQRKLAVSKGSSLTLALWQKRILSLLAKIEAEIDFSDSEDLDNNIWEKDLESCKNDIEASLNDNRGISIREGVKIVICGAVNVGKSSIYNRIQKKELAIVSDTAGTTRDRLESSLNIDGYKVLLSDTAGLREKADDIETMGIERSLEAMVDADIIIEVRSFDFPESFIENITSRNTAVDTKSQKTDVLSISRQQNNEVTIKVINKVDSVDKKTQVKLLQTLNDDYIPVSANTGEGFNSLHEAIRFNLKNIFKESVDSSSVITRIRHKQILESVVDLLEKAKQEILLEISAEHIRLAYNILLGLNDYGRTTLQGGGEAVLDMIFAKFCIGK